MDLRKGVPLGNAVSLVVDNSQKEVGDDKRVYILGAKKDALAAVEEITELNMLQKNFAEAIKSCLRVDIPIEAMGLIIGKQSRNADRWGDLFGVKVNLIELTKQTRCTYAIISSANRFAPPPNRVFLSDATVQRHRTTLFALALRGFSPLIQQFTIHVLQ